MSWSRLPSLLPPETNADLRITNERSESRFRHASHGALPTIWSDFSDAARWYIGSLVLFGSASLLLSLLDAWPGGN